VIKLDAVVNVIEYILAKAHPKEILTAKRKKRDGWC